MTIRTTMGVAPSRLLGFAALLVSLGGCASDLVVPGGEEFSCDGRPDGVVCRSTRDIYALTEDRDHVHEEDLADPVSPGAGGERVVVSQAGVTSPGALPASAAPRQGVIAGAPVAVSDPQAFALAAVRGPVRQDAQVVRIWIAPWQDQNGDLRMPGHVFAEVKPRSWSFGATPSEDPSNLLMTPAMIEARDAATVGPEAGSPLTAPLQARPQPGLPRPDFGSDRARTMEVRS